VVGTENILGQERLLMMMIMAMRLMRIMRMN